jgi:uncharacterized membrane protein
MMKHLTTIGRFVFALPFLVFGMMHFMKSGMMAGMIPSWLPGGVFWVYLTGLALVAASVSFMINKQMKLSGMLLGVMLLMFVMFLHLPMAMSGNETMMQMAMPNMLKDLSLAGGAFLMAGIGAAPKIS